ncbi:MAG TPA: DUF3105 domain-containing protein [Actinomycetota bacterium]
MATTKRKRRRPSGATAPIATPARGGANEARRERKEQARQAREAERKRAARRAAYRRAITITAVGVVAIGVFWWFNRAAAPRPIPEAAIRSAEAAGCTTVETPLDSAPANQHLQAGQSYTYDQHPATSGWHDPSPLPLDPKVYDSPINETNAVHNLEHAGVIVYYQDTGDAALSTDAVDRLATLVNGSTNVLMAPYPDLPEGQGMALTAWNKLQTCPPGVTPQQADTIASGFIEAYACTRNAPEPNASGVC